MRKASKPLDPDDPRISVEITPMVLLVAVNNPELRAQLLQSLRSAGYTMYEQGHVPPGMEVDAVIAAAIELTPREQETLAKVPVCASRDQMAHALSISIDTLDGYLKHLRDKLEVDTLHQLIAKAVAIRLLRIGPGG